MVIIITRLVIIYQSPPQTWLFRPLLPERGVCMAPERDYFQPKREKRDGFSTKVSFFVHCEPLRRPILGSSERGFQQLSLFCWEIPLCWCQNYYCEKLSLFHGNIRQDSGAQHNLKDNHKQTSAEINQVLSFHVFSLILHPPVPDQGFAMLCSLQLLSYHLQNLFSLLPFC